MEIDSCPAPDSALTPPGYVGIYYPVRDRRIMVITSAFQADDVGSIPIGRCGECPGRSLEG
jgi:hypothetical protein